MSALTDVLTGCYGSTEVWEQGDQSRLVYGEGKMLVGKTVLVE